MVTIPTESASDPGWLEGGARNMKYKGPPMAVIFFMTSFNRDRGLWPLAPPGSAAESGASKNFKMGDGRRVIGMERVGAAQKQ